MVNKKGIIYKLTFPNEKVYIGLTTQKFKTRLRTHRAYANTKKGNSIVHNAIRKYGLDNFIYEIIDESEDFEFLKELEKKYIAQYNSKYPNGYNMTDGGDGTLGAVITEANRQKRSESQLKCFQTEERRKKHLDTQRTPELREIRSKITKEKMADPIRKKMQSEVMKNKWRNPDYIAKMKSRMPIRIKINDGLNAWQRHRLKDLEAYRKRKNEYSKTDAQKNKRAEYARKWRRNQKNKKNKICH